MKRRGGFTLIELMVVIAIIAIIAAISIPGLLRARMSANERSASAALRSMFTAEDTLRQTDCDGNAKQDYWTGDISGLYFLSDADTDGDRVPDANGDNVKVIQDMAVAYADLAPLAAGVVDGSYHRGLPDPALTRPKSGYWYCSLSAMRATAHNEGEYAIIAVPSRAGRTGFNCFILGEAGTIFRRDWEGFGGDAVVDPGESAKVDAVITDYPADLELSSDWDPVQ